MFDLLRGLPQSRPDAMLVLGESAGPGRVVFLDDEVALLHSADEFDAGDVETAAAGIGRLSHAARLTSGALSLMTQHERPFVLEELLELAVAHHLVQPVDARRADVDQNVPRSARWLRDVCRLQPVGAVGSGDERLLPSLLALLDHPAWHAGRAIGADFFKCSPWGG